MFREQQEKLRALMEGCKSITVPLDGDAAAVSKFQTAFEALRKKARAWPEPRRRSLARSSRFSTCRANPRPGGSRRS